MSVSVILNPAAGRGRGLQRYRRLVDLPASWREREPVLTGGPGEATGLAAAAVRERVGLLIVAGGDGTLHEVVNGLMEAPADRRPLLAHIPVGTGCDFARGLGIADRSGALLGDPGRWRPRAVDVAEVDPDDGPRCWFLNAANVGLGPRVARWVSGGAWRRAGRAVYEVAAAAAILTTRPRTLDLWVGGEPHSGPTLNLSICNGPYFGAGMQPCPRARLDDGRLDAAWVGDIGRVAALARLPGLMRGRLREHPKLRRFEAGEIRVEGEGGVEADGELVATLPVVVRVRPAALRVLAPEGPPATQNAPGPTTD